MTDPSLFKSWLLAIRPKTLAAAIVPIMVATALIKGVYNLPSGYWISVAALVSALFIQIATNLFNDAIDFKKGADTENRIGPQRVTQSGLLSYRQVLFLALGSCFIALISGLPLVLMGGWPIVAVGLVSLFLAYSYTGGPFPLAYLGLGDLFVILFFGIIAVGGVAYIYLKEITLHALVAGIQVGCTATVLIVINNLRDRAQDKLVGKKTMAVRFGEKFSKGEVLVLYFVTFSLGLYWLKYGFKWAAFLPLLSLPLAIVLIFNFIKTPPSPIYNKFLGMSALLQICFSIFLSIGLLLS